MMSATDIDPGVAALDALTGDLLLRSGSGIGVARTLLQLQAVHKLRARYLPDALERDGYDDRAHQLGAWRGNELVGTIRLVVPVPGRPLPTEECFEVEIEPRGDVVDVGRLLIAPALRGDPEHRVWGGLVALAWQEARARGYRALAGIVSDTELERYGALGLRTEVLGPARECLGEARRPVRFDPAVNGRPGLR
jgi:hypothetical protein